MGQIISIQGGLYRYELPDVPRETDILYHDLPKKQQYWRTPHDTKKTLQIRDVMRMPEREKGVYIEQWRRWWLDGLWFMNNGEPTYITGAHFDHLAVNKFDGTFLNYLEAQRERFYFRDLAYRSPKCDGRVWIKPRRAGLTTEEITEAIRTVLMGINNKVGMQSTKLAVCDQTLMRPIIEAYRSRPRWLRESYYKSNGRTPKKELRLVDSVEDDDSENIPLGGFVKSYPTVASGLDGDGWSLIIMDEFSKWEGARPMEALNISLKAINPNKRLMIDCLSTSGDSKDAEAATKDWHTLIAASNPKILNNNGKTNSGLWKFFVSAVDSLYLLKEIPDLIDKYGRADRARAEEWILSDINKHPKNSKEYIFACYKMPLEERHAMLTASANSYFSKVRISARLEELRAMPNDRKPYVRGNFKEDKHGKVFFEADEYGDWLVALHPYYSEEKGIDTRNRFRVIDGVFFPPVNPEFDMGYDPIRQKKSQSVSNSLSDACIIIKKKWDYFGSGVSNAWAALYLKRPDDPKTAHREAFKAAKYFGCPFQHERIIDSVLELAEEERMVPFLLKSEKDGKYGIWIDNQGKIVQNGVEMLQALCVAPKTPEDVDMIADCPFEPVLQNMDGFDMANTTEFDVMMAMIEMAYASKQNVYTLLSDSTQDSLQKLIDEIIPVRN